MAMQLERGEPVEITYGNGHKITAKALGGREKIRLLKIFRELEGMESNASGAIKVLELAEEAFLICVPDASDELIESLTETQQFEIAGNVLLSASVTDEQRKK